MRQDTESGAPSRRIRATMHFSDFRAVDGVQVPHSVRIEAANGTDGTPVVFTLKYTEVKQNVSIEDAKF